jgi:hypothetical protein
VAGSSSSASGNSERVARYTDATGLQDLGGSGEHNQAWGINASLTVVGQLGQSAARAFVYTDAEGLRNLNVLVDQSEGWVLQTAFVTAFGSRFSLGALVAFRHRCRPPVFNVGAAFWG